jgi:predicted phage terminase large subunit-like protein
VVRYWDLAVTEKTELNDLDWTVGIKLGCNKNSGYWLLDLARVRASPGDVERLILNIAAQDGKKVTIGFGQDSRQAGKSQARHLVRALSGFTVRPITESGDKLTRFGPFSSQCLAGNVKILRGLWNEDLCRVLEGFPDLAHDDEVDACSGALEMFNRAMKGQGIFESYREKAEKLKAEREAASAPVKPTYARGSIEWAAEEWAAEQEAKRRGGGGDHD